MIWLLVPIIIWTVALLFMGLPHFIYQIIQKGKAKLRKGAKLARRSNPDESMVKSIEEGMLDMIHIRNLFFIGSIIGLVLMALGTVALCAVLVL
ncbi:hypothetical protein [Niallia sp. Krafla_26]|uniref:hypothetical protein n=1 Tax=Niallia sp. Krafla_26 TaxID=3064703 RepID=UPI003D180824